MLATVIGEVTDGDRLVITWDGETVVDVPPRTVAHDGPVYRRPVARSERQDALVADVPDTLPRPAAPSELRAEILRMVASPNLASRAWVTDQYDRYVRGNTVSAQPADAGMIRIDEQTGRGVAVATDCNARFVALDPYAGTQLALAEAYRNVATTGAVPIAVTNCLNFGSPEDPHVMWQFREAVRGLADGCARLGIPVTGGNVSFYNQTGDRPILPTPVVGVLGVIEDVARRVRPGFSRDGDVIVLLGETREEFGGSEWAHVAHGHLGGRPPAVDLDAEQRLARPAGRRRRRRAAHQRARPVRRRAGAGAGRVLPDRRRGRDDRRAAAASTRSWRCSPSRPPACWSRCADSEAPPGARRRGRACPPGRSGGRAATRSAST